MLNKSTTNIIIQWTYYLQIYCDTSPYINYDWNYDFSNDYDYEIIILKSGKMLLWVLQEREVRT